MKRRHLTPFCASFSLLVLLALSFLLIPTVPAQASSADLVIAKGIVPLVRPEQTPATYPDRPLHFGDPLDVSKARMTAGFGWRVHPVLKE